MQGEKRRDSCRRYASGGAREVQKDEGGTGQDGGRYSHVEAIRERLDLLLRDEIRPSAKDLVAATNALRWLKDEADAPFSPVYLLCQLDRYPGSSEKRCPTGGGPPWSGI